MIYKFYQTIDVGRSFVQLDKNGIHLLLLLTIVTNREAKIEIPNFRAI